jgi:hypothetical protein
MFVLPGAWAGRSPIEAHRETIGLGLAMQEHAARYFGNGSRPGGILKGPETSRFTKEQRAELKESWEAAHRGPANSNRVAVLEGGLEWQQVGLSDKDSQFIEQRTFQVPELCRIWGVPPYKVQEYGRATWGNTEQMAMDFLQTCMLPWYRRWEAAISWHLIDEEEPVFAEFLFEGLLRADTQTRYAAYQVATGGRAWMSPNEVRERENLNKEDGYDEISKDTQGAAPNQQQKPGQKPQNDQNQAGTSGQQSIRQWAGGRRLGRSHRGQPGQSPGPRGGSRTQGPAEAGGLPPPVVRREVPGRRKGEARANARGVAGGVPSGCHGQAPSL